MDLEVSLVRESFDLSDCTDIGGKYRCGTEYNTKAYGSVDTSMSFPCIETATVELRDPPATSAPTPAPTRGTGGGINDLKNTDAGEQGMQRSTGEKTILKLPHCDTVDETEFQCFQKTGLVMGATSGFVKCPPAPTGEEELEEYNQKFKNCAAEGDIIDTTYGIGIEISEPTFDAEGGLYKALVESLCFLPNLVRPSGDVCSADSIFTKLAREELEGSLLQKLSLDPSNGAVSMSGLKGCPAVSVIGNDLVLRMDTLDTCPPGNHDPNCLQLVSGGGISGENPESIHEVESYQVNSGNKPADPFVLDVETDDGESGPNLPIRGEKHTIMENERSGGLRGTTNGLTTGGTGGLLEGPTGNVDGLVAPEVERLSMSVIDEALKSFCAIGASCSPSLDFSKLPLMDMATDFDPLALLNNDVFVQSCLLFFDPTLYSSNGVEKALALQEWNTSLFQQALNGSCQNTPSFEDMFPVLGLTVTITIGENSIADGFAFVNFFPPELASESTHNSDNCYHRRSQGLPPADAPRCTDSRRVEGMGNVDCGTVPGGPCVDITADYYYDGFFSGVDGGLDLYQNGLHPNGGYSWKHRCGHDHESGALMVCNGGFFPGAGQNEWPVCQICGIAPDGYDSSLYTTNGCEPVGGSECPQDYALGTDGKCWSVYDGRPEWECQADCKDLYGITGYCMHSGAWMYDVRDEGVLRHFRCGGFVRGRPRLPASYLCRLELRL
jgi:hypothetical protein